MIGGVSYPKFCKSLYSQNSSLLMDQVVHSLSRQHNAIADKILTDHLLSLYLAKKVNKLFTYFMVLGGEKNQNDIHSSRKKNYIQKRKKTLYRRKNKQNEKTYKYKKNVRKTYKKKINGGGWPYDEYDDLPNTCYLYEEASKYFSGPLEKTIHTCTTECKETVPEEMKVDPP